MCKNVGNKIGSTRRLIPSTPPTPHREHPNYPSFHSGSLRITQQLSRVPGSNASFPLALRRRQPETHQRGTGVARHQDASRAFGLTRCRASAGRPLRLEGREASIRLGRRRRGQRWQIKDPPPLGKLVRRCLVRLRRWRRHRRRQRRTTSEGKADHALDGAHWAWG